MAMRLTGELLGGANPFRLLAEGLPGAAADMGSRTLVLVGATFSDGRAGFYLLEDHANLVSGDRASGEELQDHDCRLLNAVP